MLNWGGFGVPSKPILPGVNTGGWVNTAAQMDVANKSASLANGGGSFFDNWQNSDGFFGKESMLGGMDDNGNATSGWLDSGLGVAKSVADSWFAMQQLGLAKDQFAFSKDAFNKQYENQRTLTNASLEDRQRARLGANPTGYDSVANYMNKNGV
jgi:hypothetical protein